MSTAILSVCEAMETQGPADGSFCSATDSKRIWCLGAALQREELVRRRISAPCCETERQWAQEGWQGEYTFKMPWEPAE
jgi:hypothetical protein